MAVIRCRRIRRTRRTRRRRRRRSHLPSSLSTFCVSVYFRTSLYNYTPVLCTSFHSQSLNLVRLAQTYFKLQAQAQASIDWRLTIGSWSLIPVRVASCPKMDKWPGAQAHLVHQSTSTPEPQSTSILIPPLFIPMSSTNPIYTRYPILPDSSGPFPTSSVF